MEKMIYKWLESGIITKETALFMIKDIKEEKSKNHRIKINILIYTMVAILIGAGVITFIAANDWLLELLNSFPVIKIILMICLTAGSLLGGYKLAYESEKFPKLGHCLIFLSTLLIGGTYALTGQIYNINADNSFLMFLWLFSIVPAAYIFNSSAVNAVCIILLILGVIFGYMDLGLDFEVTWTIFVPVLLGSLLYTLGNIPIINKKFSKFAVQYKLAGLAPVFFTLMVLICSADETYQQTSPFYTAPLVLLIAANIINYFSSPQKSFLLKAETIFFSVLLMCLFAMITLPEVSSPLIMISANIALITIISFGYNYGYKFENSKIIGLTNNFLIIYLLVNYCRWGWNYMEKTAFFLIGGILLLAGGMFLEHKRKNFIKKGQ